MRILLLLTALFTLPFYASADNEALLEELDAAILQRSQFMKSKQEKIEFLKKNLKTEHDHHAALSMMDNLYNELYVFKFDSAMAYVDKGLALAAQQHDDYYTALFTIHRSEILAIGGLYTEAIDNLDALDATTIDQRLRFKYHFTLFSIYSFWSDYCHDKTFGPQYRTKANVCLQQAMQYVDKSSILYEYYQGELNVYVTSNASAARQHYLNVLSKASEESREYAMAAFALAGNYGQDNRPEKYEEYLIRAALSDLKSCTMENMALQSLAIHLFKEGKGQIERAERYINLSMEDAKFYNNRLRILEISAMLPQIMSTYQATVKRQNTHLRYSIVFISLLVLGLLFTAYLIHRKNRQLAARRRELSANNRQLIDLNQQLSASNQQQVNLNEQLKELNQQLVDTNQRREGLASIYIDLCARYIDKLGKYQTLVKRKIKAHQEQELLQTISSTRISEEDAATFLNRFDKAFLELYPTFVDEFNALLLEDGRIQQKSPATLTTELRTFALIRLGVKNTADIAGLLFLSTQTIYNCRSVIKNRAINKDTFDEDVQKLCVIIQ